MIIRSNSGLEFEQLSNLDSELYDELKYLSDKYLKEIIIIISSIFIFLFFYLRIKKYILKVNWKNILFSMSIYISLFYLISYLIPFNSIPQATFEAYIASLFKKWIFLHIKLIKDFRNITPKSLLMSCAFVIFPFGSFLDFIMSSWIDLNIKSIPCNLTADDKETLARTVTDIKKTYGPKGLYGIVDHLTAAYNYDVDNNIITRSEVKAQIEVTLEKLKAVNTRAIIDMQDLILFKHLCRYTYLPEVKDILMGLSNNDPITKKNAPAFDWTVRPWKKQIIIEELRIIRDDDFKWA